jgi:SpoVK/Ycf46/Vps4 family AAA+-type ATPase
MRIFTLTFIGILAFNFNAAATIYKCTDSDGHDSFKDKPCSPSEQKQWQKETEVEENSRKYREALSGNNNSSKSDVNAENTTAKWKKVDTPQHVKNGILEHLDLLLKDPDSLKDMKWLGTETDGKSYKVMVFFRAKNSWGAYGVSQFIFDVAMDGSVYSKTEIK